MTRSIEKALILAAGYGTRLGLDKAKSLVDVNGYTLLEHLLFKLLGLPDIEEVSIITNARFYGDFE